MRRGQESKQVMREHLFVNEIKAEIKSRLDLKGKFKDSKLLQSFKKKKKEQK